MNLASQLDRLENTQLLRRLVEEESAYTFRHALTQESAYGSLLKNQRREIHLRVAQTIEELYPEQLDENASRLAQHYAEARDDGKTAEYATRGGDVAARLFAYPEARVNYALALDAISRLPDDDANRRRRLDVLIQQVSVSLRSAGPAETLNRLTEAETMAQDFAERADTSREDRVRLARINFWQGHALLHHGDSRASMEKMRAVMTVAQAENEPPLLAVSASVIGRGLVVRGQFAQAIPVLSDAVTALEQTHDENEWIFSVGMRGFVMAMRGEVAQGIAEAERTLVRANQVGTLTGISVAHFIIALTHLFCDSIPLALDHSREVIETSAKSGDHLHAFVGHGFLGWAQTRADQLEEAENSFARANEIAQAIGARLSFSDGFAVARAEHLLRRGEHAQVIALAQEEIALAQKSGATFYTGMMHRVCAQALAKSRSESWGEIENQLASSLCLFEEGDARLETARVHLAWGKMLRERGDANSASEHFQKAAAQFESAGLTRELNETRELMRVEKIDS